MTFFRIFSGAAFAVSLLASSSVFAQEADDVDVLAIPGQVVEGVTGGVADVLGLGDNEDANAACARRFRSFDPETGTYTTYSGERVTCPYLRG